MEFRGLRQLEEGARSILTRKCVVYGNALSVSSILFLARQHNDYNQIQRVTSFPEVASCCRCLLFAHFGGNRIDEESVCLDIPRYNSQPYQDYKKECVLYCQLPDSKSHFAYSCVEVGMAQVIFAQTYIALAVHGVFRI